MVAVDDSSKVRSKVSRCFQPEKKGGNGPLFNQHRLRPEKGRSIVQKRDLTKVKYRVSHTFVFTPTKDIKVSLIPLTQSGEPDSSHRLEGILPAGTPVKTGAIGRFRELVVGEFQTTYRAKDGTVANRQYPTATFGAESDFELLSWKPYSAAAKVTVSDEYLAAIQAATAQANDPSETF